MIPIKYLNFLKPYIKMFTNSDTVYKKFYTFNLKNNTYVTLSKPSLCAHSKIHGITCIQIIRNKSVSEIKRIFETQSPQEKLTKMMYDATSGRIHCSDLEEIIKTLEDSTHELKDYNAFFLLQCCGNLLPDVQLKKKHELTAIVWNLIQKKCNELTLNHFHTLLMIYLENSQCINPYEFLKCMTVDPNEDTYRLLLNMVAQDGNYKLVNKILNEMNEKDYALTEKELTAMVQVHSLHGDLENALNIIEYMKSKDMEPPSKAYGHLACGYARINDIKNVTETLKKNSLDAEDLMKIVKFLSCHSNVLYVPNILEFLTVPKLEKAEPVIRNTIIELLCKNNTTSAYAILNRVSTLDNTIMIDLIDTFLRTMIELNTPYAAILSITDKLSRTEYPENILVKIAEILLCLFEKRLALSTFELMKERGVTVKSHYYWPLFRNVCKDESEIFSLIQHMKRLDVEIDFDTLLYYVYPHINTTNSNATFQKLKAEKLNTSVIQTSLIVFLLNSDKFREAKYLYDTSETDIFHLYVIPPLINVFKRTKNVDECMSWIHRLFYRRRSIGAHFLMDLLYEDQHEVSIKDMCKLLQAYEKYKIKIGVLDLDTIKKSIVRTAFYNEDLKKSLNSLGDFKNAQTIIDTVGAHQSLMTVKQLECHLIELESKGMNTKTVLRKLFQMYCVNANLDKVKEIKKKMHSAGFTLTPGMKANQFDLYVNENMFAEALLELVEIQEQFREFNIDNFKILNFAHKLVKSNKLNEAVGLIKRFQNVSHKTNTNVNCERLLEAVAENKNSNDVEKMLNTLLDHNYCQANERTLSCLVTVHLLQNDIESAVKAFEKCTDLYKVLPAKYNILTSLIKLRGTQSTENVQKHLDKIYDLIRAFQGKQCANLNFIIALAKCNETEELQNRLQEQHVSTNYIMNYVSYLPNKTIVQILLEILKANAIVKVFNPQPLLDYVRDKSSLLETGEADLIEKEIQTITKSTINLKHMSNKITK